MSVFSRAKKEQTNAKESINIVGADSKFMGSLTTEGSVEVYGTMLAFGGDAKVAIKSANNVFIADCATVTGDIHGKAISIEGVVTGNIFADGVVHLVKGAQLKGDIDSVSLVIEDGVVFGGKVSTRATASVNLGTKSYLEPLE